MDNKEFIITADQRLNEKELDLEVFNFPIAIFSFFKTMADIEAWEKQGAECVNAETGTFYTVARELDIESIYFGFILDLIHTEKWTGWGGLDDELKGKVVSMKSNLELVEDLAVKIAKEIKQSVVNRGQVPRR